MALGRFLHVRMFTVLVEASTKTVNIITRWNLPIRLCMKNSDCEQPGGDCIILVGNEGFCNNSFVDLDKTTPINPNGPILKSGFR